MSKMYSQFSYVLLMLLIVCVVGVFADSNGIWHEASDVRAGVFSADEGSGVFVFNNNLSIRSPTTQGFLEISGASDGGSTYSALYLHDNTEDNNNIWVFSQKNEAGTVTENDLQIGYYNDVGAYRVDVAVDSATGNVGIGTTSPGSSLHILAKPYTSFNNHFGGIRVVAASGYAPPVAPGITFELNSGAIDFDVGAVGVASGDGSYADDAHRNDIVVKSAPGGSVRLVARPTALVQNTILEAKPNGDIVAKRYCFPSGGCLVG